MSRVRTTKDLWASDLEFNSSYWENLTIRRTDIDRLCIQDSVIDTFQFTNCCLTELELNQTSFENGTIEGVHFEKFLIDEGGGFETTTFTESSFNKSQIFMSVFEKCVFEGELIFTTCVFDSVTFIGCNFEDIRFENCVFIGVKFIECTFSGKYSTYRKQDTNQIKFVKCTFTKSEMKDCTFFARTTRDGRTAFTTGRSSVRFTNCVTYGLGIIDCNTAGLDMAGLLSDKVIRTGTELKIPPARKNLKATVCEGKINIADELIPIEPAYSCLGSARSWGPHNNRRGLIRASSNKRTTYNDKNKNVFWPPINNKKRAYRFVTSGI